MKKTMFITSVIMVVVMAIALTTSSLAWFSANGSPTVTTNAMTMTAKGESATGLKISDDAISWDSSVSLASGNAMANMYPVLPYEATSGNSLLDALYAKNFVNSTVNGDRYAGDVSTSSNITVLDKIIYIANYDAADNKHLTASIAWKTADGTDDYSHVSGNAVLCVAVLANKNVYTKADRTDRTVSSSADDWEILNVFTSDGADDGAGSGTTVRYGKTYAAFGANQVVGDSYYTLTTASTFGESGKSGDENTNSKADYQEFGDAKGTSTVNLLHAAIVDGEQLSYGDVQELRVLAWYDGIMLKNANSGGATPFGIQFALTFSDGD